MPRPLPMFLITLLSVLALGLTACTDDAPETAEPTDDTEADAEPDEPDGDAAEEADDADDAAGDALTANPTDCLDEVPPGGAFPEQASFSHAEAVDVTYFDTHKLLEISTPFGEEPERFALVQCGLEAEDLDDDVHVVEVPIDTAISLTTTPLPHYDALDAAETVAGVGVTDFVSTESIRDRIDAGEVESYATAEGAPDIERVIAAAPDVLVLDAFGEETLDDVARLADADVPSLLNSDFYETTLLGRAEWVKVTGMLLNAEAAAGDVFADVAANYEEVRAAVADVDDRPQVLAEQPFEGTWFAPGGASFIANGIADAGGEYVFGDNDETGSSPYDIETVIDQAADADVWIQAGSVHGTLDDLIAIDERVAEIRAFAEGNVWAVDAQATPEGANPRFERAFLAADEFLADLVAIFHPDAIDHEPVYYGRVEE